ncbi:MAG: hypothetical protein RLZZ453_552 [Chlamydiota bacterium]|jgi:MscS family membrane protein
MELETSLPLLSTLTGDRLWLVELITGLSALVISNFIVKKIVQKIRHHSLSRTSKWQEHLDHILYVPFQILLWILGATLVIQTLEKRFEFSFFGAYINSFRMTAFIICAGWILFRWKDVLQKRLLAQDLQHKKIDVGVAQVIGKLLSIVIILISGMLILEAWGMNIAPLLAFGGVGAAAIGFSAKDILANVFGGMMLHLNRPFVIGDFIYLPIQKIEGYVEEIGWNTTTLRDKDKRPLYLPNSTFSSSFVVNGSRMTHRRVYETISIPYSEATKLEQLTLSLESLLKSHPDIDRYLPVLVTLDNFSNANFNLLVDVYTLKTRYDEYLRSKHAILLAIYGELQQHQVQLASPSLTISGSLSPL